MKKQTITESFKNTILGWVGIRSNNIKIEDLIDAYCKDPKHAERSNRMKGKAPNNKGKKRSE